LAEYFDHSVFDNFDFSLRYQALSDTDWDLLMPFGFAGGIGVLFGSLFAGLFVGDTLLSVLGG